MIRKPQRLLAGLAYALALGALAAGCAGPGASAPSPPASELSGTWRGTFGQVAASLYLAESTCILQIREDGTFTATVTPLRRSNNIAKAWTWSGTVVGRGSRVTLQSSQGASVTFVRSGNTLYGVAVDPMIGATIMMSLERDP
jgi:hypothetical protein